VKLAKTVNYDVNNFLNTLIKCYVPVLVPE